MSERPGILEMGSKREKLAIAARLRWKDPAFRSAMLKDRKPFRFGVKARPARLRLRDVADWMVDASFDELKPGELPKPRS